MARRSGFTAQQSRVLSLIYFNAEAPLAWVAREAGCREHVVRRFLAGLRQQEILGAHTYLNVYRLGIIEYQVFLSLITPGEKARQKLTDALMASKLVSWLCPVGGPFDFDVLVQASSLGDVSGFLDSLSTSVADVEFEKTVAAQVSLAYFLPKYIGPMCASASPQYLLFEQGPPVHSVDEIDKKLIRALALHPELALARHARDLKLPPTTVHHRVSRLKEKGIIGAFGNYVYPYSAGYHPYNLILELKRGSDDFRKRLFAFATRAPNITYMIRNLGAFDYQLGARVSDPREIPGIVEAIREKFPREIKRIIPVQVYQPLRFGGALVSEAS